MRSSKSRSRSKQNRPRPVGNIINRVFESSGPEGKVRGTPQQIIEKYLVLARDAQLSNDRVAAENFLQHAEHYTRMLGEAQREIAAEQEARRQQFPTQGGERSPERGPERGAERGTERTGERPSQGGERQGGERQGRERPPREDEAEDASSGLMPALGFADDDDSGLVDLPEARRTGTEPSETAAPSDPSAADAPRTAASAQATRPARKRAPAGDLKDKGATDARPEAGTEAGAEGAEGGARTGRGRGRTPRRPRGQGPSGASETETSAADAANDGTAAAE